jgi:hypothetical protein
MNRKIIIPRFLFSGLVCSSLLVGCQNLNGTSNDSPDPAALRAKGSDSAQGASAKVEVCHIPPGNPANAHTITVGAPAVSAHLDHGDVLGACKDTVPPGCDDCTPG